MQFMRLVWRIFAIIIAVAALLAPATALCISRSGSGHSCCMAERQISAQDCCSHAAPQAPAAVRPASSLISELPPSLATYEAPSFKSHVTSLPSRTLAIPVQPPATILRT
jgi:hypothetical protein